MIVITGHGDRGWQKRAFAAGASAFFEKPFDPEALIEMVEKLVAA